MTAKTKKTAKAGSEFDYTTIKSFEDACMKENIDPLMLPDASMIPESFRKAIINAYKLMIIFKAINNGWVPNWKNRDEYKYFPWFYVSPSGAGLSHSVFRYAFTSTAVSSRLCTDTSEKALFIAKQFEAEYKEFLLYN